MPIHFGQMTLRTSELSPLLLLLSSTECLNTADTALTDLAVTLSLKQSVSCLCPWFLHQYWHVFSTAWCHIAKLLSVRVSDYKILSIECLNTDVTINPLMQGFPKYGPWARIWPIRHLHFRPARKACEAYWHWYNMRSKSELVARLIDDFRPLSHLVTDRRLRLFGHIARSSPQEDHHHAVAAVIRELPPDWKRPSASPGFVQWRQTKQNIGLASAWRKAAIRDDWRRIVDTATLQRSML